MRYLISGSFMAIGLAFLFLVPESTKAGNDYSKQYPKIIEIEQPHAWCYLLKNEQNKLVGDIHILSCVPKGDNNHNRLSRGQSSD